MPTRRQEMTGPVGVLSQCRHYWIIDSSQQTESRGRCQLCGEERVFQNKLSPANKKRGIVVEELPVTDDPTSGVPDDCDE